MYCDANVLVEFVVAIGVVVATSLAARRLGFALSMANAPMRTHGFWLTMAVFLGPLGLVNRVLFCDGLILQLAIITLVAGAGIWAANRAFGRGR